MLYPGLTVIKRFFLCVISRGSVYMAIWIKIYGKKQGKKPYSQHYRSQVLVVVFFPPNNSIIAKSMAMIVNYIFMP